MNCGIIDAILDLDLLLIPNHVHRMALACLCIFSWALKLESKKQHHACSCCAYQEGVTNWPSWLIAGLLVKFESVLCVTEPRDHPLNWWWIHPTYLLRSKMCYVGKKLYAFTNPLGFRYLSNELVWWAPHGESATCALTNFNELSPLQ